MNRTDRMPASEHVRRDHAPSFLGRSIDDRTQFDLRTSLNGIIGLLHVSLNDELTAVQRLRLRKVLSAGYELVGLLDANVICGEICEFVLEDVFAHLRCAYGVLCEPRKLTFGILAAEDVPAVLKGDPRLLVTLIGGMLAEAVTAVGYGGGVTVQVFRGFRRADGKICLRFEVHDTGGVYMVSAETDADGIPVEELRDHWRVIAERQGGRVGEYDVPASGSVRWVELAFGAADPQLPGPEVLAGLRILLAEDNVLHREAGRGLLESAGADVVLAGDGEDALVRYCDAVGGAPFDCILLDLQMPKMDGLETVRRLRALGAKMPIVAISANVQGAMRLRCEEAGMDAYLAKPVLPQMLHSVLGRLLVPEAESDDIANLRNARLLLAADDTTWRRLLDVFRKTTKSDMDILRQSMVRGEWWTVARRAHRIAGSCRIIGLHAAAREFALFEQLADSGQEAAANQLLGLIDKLLLDAAVIVSGELATLLPE